VKKNKFISLLSSFFDDINNKGFVAERGV